MSLILAGATDPDRRHEGAVCSGRRGRDQAVVNAGSQVIGRKTRSPGYSRAANRHVHTRVSSGSRGIGRPQHRLSIVDATEFSYRS